MKATWKSIWVVAMLALAVNANAADTGETNPKTGEEWKLGDSIEGKIAKIGDDRGATICNQEQCSEVPHQKQNGLKVGDQVNCKAVGYECAGLLWDCTAATP